MGQGARACGRIPIPNGGGRGGQAWHAAERALSGIRYEDGVFMYAMERIGGFGGRTAWSSGREVDIGGEQEEVKKAPACEFLMFNIGLRTQCCLRLMMGCMLGSGGE